MKVKYLGHASFLITLDDGTRVITDPYQTSEDLTYGEIRESADIVTVSHDHFDHNNVAAVRGNPEVVRGSARVKGIDFKGIPSYHDDAGGTMRGGNTILCFEVDGVRVCHLGDLGHQLSDEQVAGLGGVDILLVPVGGFFTIDARGATGVCDRVKPRVVVPMHCNYKWSHPEIASVEEFLEGKANVDRLDTSEMEFKSGALPAGTRIIVLTPAL
jgi:L-ascorbate metabolism protein UlaG (beta-lactamase superfamily)